MKVFGILAKMVQEKRALSDHGGTEKVQTQPQQPVIVWP